MYLQSSGDITRVMPCCTENVRKGISEEVCRVLSQRLQVLESRDSKELLDMLVVHFNWCYLAHASWRDHKYVDAYKKSQ